MTRITNYYERLPASGQAPKKMVILLHGVGSNGRDLISLAPYWASYVPDAVFISPDAPFECDMVPPGYPDSYQWFSLQSRDPQAMLEGVKMVEPIVHDFIEEQLARYNLTPGDLVLVGFSQGTMTSLHVGPRFRKPIAGILGFSGALLWEVGADAARLHKIPVHLIHGEADDVVPVEARAMAEQVLKAEGFTVTGHTTPWLTHSIDEKGIESGGEFLAGVLK